MTQKNVRLRNCSAQYLGIVVFTVLLTAVCLSFRCVANAQERMPATIDISVAAPIGGEATAQVAPAQHLDAGTTETFKVNLPIVPNGKQVRLALKARIDWPSLAGSNPYMVVQINGTALTLPDLVNKEAEFTMRDGSDTTWAYGTAWRILYAPDFSDDVKTKNFAYGIPDTDPYRFAWNITPYLKPGDNSIVITNLQVISQPTPLILKDIDIEVGSPISAATAQVQPAPTGVLPIYEAAGKQKVAMQVALGEDGALQFQVGSRRFSVVTRTSLPDGNWYSTGSIGKFPSITRGQSATAQWAGSGYTVSRKVSVQDDCIHIVDTFRNTSTNLVGVMYENRLALPEKPQQILLAGRPVFSDTQSVQNPEHPSVLARWNGVAVGMVAGDDVFRAQNQAFVEPSTIGLADNQLGIASGQSRTLEWSIYPLPHGNYWDFINAVRRNWGVNFQLPLVAFDFPGLAKNAPAPKEQCERVKAFGVHWLISDQAFYEPEEIKPDEMVRPKEVEQLTQRKGGSLVAEGTGILHAKQWLDRARDWSKKVHQCDSALKTLIYLHTQIVTEPKHYEKYADDVVTDAAGKTVNTSYSFPLPLYLPTLDNAYGKALLEAIPKILQQTNADGFYNDEMDYATTPYTYNPKMWDGATVMIDAKTHALQGKRSSVILLQQPWKVAFARLLANEGKVLFGNGEPSTRTLTNLHTPRFVETSSYSNLINSHFGSPLGLDNHNVVSSDGDLAHMTHRFLDYGALMVPYLWNGKPAEQPFFLSLMYPITPEELHAGMVLGKERIVTNRSGCYGWQDNSTADVYVFDGEGKRVKAPQVKTVRDGRKVLIELRMPSDYFAVLVKRQTGK